MAVQIFPRSLAVQIFPRTLIPILRKNLNFKKIELKFRVNCRIVDLFSIELQIASILIHSILIFRNS